MNENLPTEFQGTLTGIRLEHFFNVACDESSRNGDTPESFIIESTYTPYGKVRVTVQVRTDD